MKQYLYKSIYLSIGLILSALFGYSQQNNNWAFGAHAGLDFNYSPALPVYTGIERGSPSATVSDNNGQLLFYTNGDQVWNSNHELMPNGLQLVTDPLLPSGWNGMYISSVNINSQNGTWTALGATIITPVPGSRYRYYIFSLTPQWLSPYQGRLYYSIVNMNLDGGLGDVETKGILLDSGLVATPELGASYCGAPLEAIHGEYCDLWLLGIKRNQQQGSLLASYNITEQGISTPVLSVLGMGAASTFCISPDRQRIAFTNRAMLFDFNPSTGTVIEPGLSLGVPHNNTYKHLAFSSDGSKLYFIRKGWGEFGILQYDLDAVDIPSSKSLIWEEPFLGPSNLRLGPDGKIYINPPSIFSPALFGTIQSPNEVGTACDLVLNTPIYAAGSCLNHYELPRFVPAIPYDTLTSFHQVATPACMSVTLRATDTAGREYLWSDGSREDSLIVSEAGWYLVQYISSPCTYHVDSFEVTLLEVPVPDLGADTTYCYGDLVKVPLHAPEGTGLELLWSNGSQLPVLTVTDSGQYWLQVAIGDCKESDTLTISRMQCDCYLGMPNAFTPNGDGVNDLFAPLINPDCPGAAAYFFNIYNRFGQRIYSSVNPGAGWDGSHNGVPVDVGTYFYEVGFDNGLSGKKHHKQGDITLIR